MKRLALLLVAAGALGTGCVVSSDSPGDLTLYWTFSRRAPAQQGGYLEYDSDYLHGSTSARGVCGESQVDTVRVWDPSGAPHDVSCVDQYGVQGVTFAGVDGGSYDLRLQGWRKNVLVYDTTAHVHVDGSQAFVIPLEGLSAAMDIFGYLASSITSPPTYYANCAEAQNPRLHYRVYDFYGNAVEEDTVACTDPLPATAFVGSLDLDDYYVRIQGLDATQLVVLDSCWQELNHFAAQTGDQGIAPVLLTHPVPTCTVPPTFHASL